MPRPRLIDDNDVIEKATYLFLQRGYAATSIRHLEQALGMKAPSIYNRFGSKEGLFQHVFHYYLEEIVEGRIRTYLHHSEPLIGLREFFDTSYGSRDKQSQPVCLLISSALQADNFDEPIHQLVKEGNKRLYHAFYNNLKRASKHQLIHQTVDLDTLAEHLLLCLQGLLVTQKIVLDRSEYLSKIDGIFSLMPFIKKTEGHHNG